MGTPSINARGLPSNLLDVHLAGIKPTVRLSVLFGLERLRISLVHIHILHE